MTHSPWVTQTRCVKIRSTYTSNSRTLHESGTGTPIIRQSVIPVPLEPFHLRYTKPSLSNDTRSGPEVTVQEEERHTGARVSEGGETRTHGRNILSCNLEGVPRYHAEGTLVRVFHVPLYGSSENDDDNIE